MEAGTATLAFAIVVVPEVVVDGTGNIPLLELLTRWEFLKFLPSKVVSLA